MRVLLRVLGLFGGVGLLLYGLMPANLWQYLRGNAPYLESRIADSRWITIMWAGAVVLAVAVWASVPRARSASTRVTLRPGLLNLSLAFSLLFVLLTLQLLHSVFVYAASTYNRTSTTESGQTYSNSRPVIESLRVKRGMIYDRNNVVLADGRIAANGIAQRTYPVAGIADIRAFSNLLGYYSSIYGISGLEAQWNGYLSGTEGQVLRPVLDDLYNRPHVGNNLQLTIDWQLQARVWDILNQFGGGLPASAVVMDPRSGAVLALGSTPGFDPQGLALNPDGDDAAEVERIEANWKQINADENYPLINRPLEGQYVPGSTFKTLTAVGVLENEQVLRQPEPLNCPNEYFPDPNAPPVVNAVGPPNFPSQPPLQTIIESQSRRPIDLSNAYAFSCNTAFAQLGTRLGPDTFTELGERFHFYPPPNAPSRSTDFTDLPTRPSLLMSPGNAGSLDNPGALAATAFGQGELLVTSMQMALLGATIANDGVMPQPYMVQNVTDPENPEVFLYQHTAPSVLLGDRRLISSENARKMREMMREGVTIGFGKAANVADSGGKSGSGEAGNNIIHAAFLAIAPVQEPRYVVYVQIENGRDGAGVGARTAGAILQACVEIFG